MRYHIATETIQDWTFLSLKWYNPYKEEWVRVWSRRVTGSSEAYEELLNLLDELTIQHTSIELV